MKCFGCDGLGYIIDIDLYAVELTENYGFEYYYEEVNINLSLLAEAYGSDYVEYVEYLLCPWCDGTGKELK